MGTDFYSRIAAMDNKRKQFVMNLLHQLRLQVAILLITHKSVLAQKADRVYALANGQLQLARIHDWLAENRAALEGILR